MSYSRSFTKRIAVHYSGTVNYPASNTSGSVSYSGTAYEDVTVNIRVETDPFDYSVDDCNGHVGLLTGAVVATETAQVASIREKAIKVGDTIISGFFKTVRSEISQQISELSSRIDATLIHLVELSKRCLDKKRQMEVDYNRLSDRYMKVFDELNAELRNRVYELDKPTFKFRETSDKNSYRALGSDIVGTVAVAGAENSRLEALITASVVKKQAKDTIGMANDFLQKQKKTETLLHECIMDDSSDGQYYVPVCYMEACDEYNCIGREVYDTEGLFFDKEYLMEAIGNRQWNGSADEGALGRIHNYFIDEVSANYDTADRHSGRVVEYINKLFNSNNIETF
ncbi:MAG TPA: hypothetical protein IAC03_02435 [Candidatus Coprenecus pullistercoris]|nr:hypothetical protein [Candidatus Coprenecus pullistercoris]